MSDTAEGAVGHKTILLVEDDEQVRLVTRRLLERIGHEVVEFSDPEAALAAIDTHSVRPHLLLTDLVMPTMSGVQLSLKVAARMPGIRTLIMSGYAPEDTLTSMAHLSEVTYLQKPFEFHELATAVRRALTLE